MTKEGVQLIVIVVVGSKNRESLGMMGVRKQGAVNKMLFWE